MKIGMVCPYDMLRHAGGVQECVSALQTELTKRGHQVVIITPRPSGYKGREPKDMIFIGKSKRIKTPQHTSPDISISVDLKQISQLLEGANFDIVHIHEPLVPFLPLQILSRLTCPVVGTLHASMPETVLAKTLAGPIGFYIRSVIKKLYFLTDVSPAATSYIDGYQHAPITYIPNGIDLKTYKPPKSKVANKQKTILYIGRLEARKGVKYLLKAYEILAVEHPDVRLLIAGNGFDRAKLEKYVIDHHLPRVKFLGFVSLETKVKLLQEADLFCAPALFGESFGIVLLEAMATGLPIVAGDNQGFRSVLNGRGQLSLVNSDDTQAMVRHMELLLYDEVIRQAWLDWALTTVQNYDYPKVVDQYVAVYHRALAEAIKL